MSFIGNTDPGEWSELTPEQYKGALQRGRAIQDIFPVSEPGKKPEADPNGKQPHEPGAKLDHGKSPVYRGLLAYFPRACLAVANVSAAGAEKYAWKGWEAVPDGVNRYSDALGRHIVNEGIDGPLDPDGYLHKAQIAWNALAALELYLREQE